MIKVNLFFCLLLLSLTYSCTPINTIDPKQQKQDYYIIMVNQTISDIVYFKDPKTNLCFAIITWSRIYAGNSGITWVPCDSIPESVFIK